MSRLQTPVRKNDTVVVVGGKDRGKRGRVLRVPKPKQLESFKSGVGMKIHYSEFGKAPIFRW